MRGRSGDNDGHARGDDARHRPESASVVAGNERNLTRIENPLGFGSVSGLAFENQSADEGAAHRSRHVLEPDRRPSVQEAPRADLRGHFSGGADTREMDLGRIQSRERFSDRRSSVGWCCPSEAAVGSQH